MSESEKRTSAMWIGARRGIGWGLGFVSVVGVANTLGRGTRTTLKGAIKGFFGARAAAAEAAERMQDLYAEAESEHRADTLAREEG